MPRIGHSYDLCEAGSHAQQTSTGTGNVQTFTPPKDASGMLITVETNACRITFDGTAPAAGAGLVLPKDAVPVFIPLGDSATVKVASTIAGNSIVNVLWLR